MPTTARDLKQFSHSSCAVAKRTCLGENGVILGGAIVVGHGEVVDTVLVGRGVGVAVARSVDEAQGKVDVEAM